MKQADLDNRLGFYGDDNSFDAEETETIMRGLIEERGRAKEADERKRSRGIDLSQRQLLDDLLLEQSELH